MENKKDINNLASSISELSLNELVELCNAISHKYGYSNIKEFLNALGPSNESAKPEVEEVVQSKTCDLVLTAVSGETKDKINTVRKIKDLLGCTALEAKEKADSVVGGPLVLKTGILHADAEAIISEWAAINAKVEKK